MNLVYILTWVVVSYNGAEKIDAGKYYILGIRNGFTTEKAYYNPQHRTVHRKTFTCKDSLNSFIKKIYEFKQNGIPISSDRIENINVESYELQN